MGTVNRRHPGYSWDLFYKEAGEEPTPWVAMVIEKHLGKRRGSAVDLGAGNLRDAKQLVRLGFSPVSAVDHVRGFGAQQAEGIVCIERPIESLKTLEESLDLIICCQSLFFLHKPEIKRVLRRGYAALKPGGSMAFNLVGVGDTWSGEPDFTIFSYRDVAMIERSYPGAAIYESRGPVGPLMSATMQYRHVYVVVLEKKEPG